MKPDPQKIHKIEEMLVPEEKKPYKVFKDRPTTWKDLYTITVHKHIINENYHRKIKIIYGQKHMSRLSTTLNNFLVGKVVFLILTTIERYLFTQTLDLMKIKQSFCWNQEIKKIVKSLRIIQGPSPLRARNLVVSDLLSETKGSRFESGCWLCAKVSSLQ